MPIFMDRHDVSETVTAEIVAHLHQEDLKIQDEFLCRGLTYWFDDKRKTAFCLIEAPDETAIQKMHNHAHGQVPNSIIEVEPGIVESFLGRIEDPEKAQNTALNIINDPAFRTIMVIIFEELKPERNSVNQARQSFKKTILKLLNDHEGNIVKQSECYLLVSFKSVSRAVSASLRISTLDKAGFFLKTGLSAGVPVNGRKLFFEETIKLAERMCQAIKGELIISSEVKDLYNGENVEPITTAHNIYCLKPADEAFLTLLMDYLEDSWSDSNLKIEDFCKPLRCSKSQLYRHMIRLTDKSPNTFIKDYRLKQAAGLLTKNAGANISEIAFETGFTSPSYFSKCFQKKYGRQPSDYLAVMAG